MFPWYNGYKIGDSLPEDDCLGIQQLYGVKEKQWAPLYPNKHHHHYHPTSCRPTHRPTTPRPRTERPYTNPTQRPNKPHHHPDDRHRYNEIDSDSPPETCDTSYDAITLFRGELFIFKGKVR